MIERKAGEFEPEKYHDRYVEALEELIDRKRKGKKIETEDEDKPARGGNVIDLMAALKRSIEKPGGGGGGEAKKAPAKKSGAKKPAAAKKATPKKAPAKAAPARKRA